MISGAGNTREGKERTRIDFCSHSTGGDSLVAAGDSRCVTEGGVAAVLLGRHRGYIASSRSDRIRTSLQINKPVVKNMAAGTGFEDGTQLPEGAGGAAFSSSYDEQPRSQVISRDSSTTSEEVMSNLDEDSSDFHSVHSRPESAEPVVNEVEPVPNGTGGVEWGGEGRSSTAVANAQNGAESIRHKRNLSEEEGAGQGQGQLLRKACDLCTKVRGLSGQYEVFLKISFPSFGRVLWRRIEAVGKLYGK